MLGEHNLENLLVALGCAHALGLDLSVATKAWESATGSPGRLERIAHPQDVAVLVDYAHTPEALQRVLDTMRAVTPKRLIVVFGAGGDRDKGKRPEMGRVGAQCADLCVLTSDNPRSEDPRRRGPLRADERQSTKRRSAPHPRRSRSRRQASR
jgi:UDP-N-acetylmuramyl tripeptide synthase